MSRCTYPEELLELRAVVECRDVHREAEQVLSPLPPLLNHRGLKPACSHPQARGGERGSDLYISLNMYVSLNPI